MAIYNLHQWQYPPNQSIPQQKTIHRPYLLQHLHVHIIRSPCRLLWSFHYDFTGQGLPHQWKSTQTMFIPSVAVYTDHVHPLSGSLHRTCLSPQWQSTQTMFIPSEKSTHNMLIPSVAVYIEHVYPLSDSLHRPCSSPQWQYTQNMLIPSVTVYTEHVNPLREVYT